MGRGSFTLAELHDLETNPNVIRVSDNRIIYTRAFKVHFVDEYRKGKKPTQIFREAGFDTKVLGSKRIERAAANWKETYLKNTLRLEMDEQFVQEEIQIGKDKENQLLLTKLMKEMETLKEQVSTLSSMLGIEQNPNHA